MSAAITGLKFITVRCPTCKEVMAAHRENQDDMSCYVGECDTCSKYWKLTREGEGKVRAEEMKRS